jgi:hypothetical protein
MIKKSVIGFLLAVLLVGFLLASLTTIGIVQAATNVSGILNSDTNWTLANGPYTLTGNLLVKGGTILTIEPGVTVNLNGYYIMVNGSLQARGTTNNQIIFNGGQINITPYSLGWNESTSTGCIIENAVISSNLVLSNSAKINKDNILAGINVQSTTSAMQTGLPLISNSFIKGGISIGTVLGGAYVINNTLVGGGISCGWILNPPNATIIGNTISGWGTAISVALGGDNNGNGLSGYYGRPYGFQTIENNLIVNNSVGILLNVYESDRSPLIQNNTVTANSFGFITEYGFGNNNPFLLCNLTLNNIYGNSAYNFRNQLPTSLNVQNKLVGNDQYLGYRRKHLRC